MKVYVRSIINEPLMPTSPRNARLLLKKGLAKVVCLIPFTVKMLVTTKEYKQDITLGVDAGSKNIGLSATTETEELLSGEGENRSNVVELISTRRELRRNRRSRKTRYRQPRFNNRKHSKFAPSIIQKIQTHINLIKKVCGWLPITKIIVEVAQFDIQKIKNPNIQGVEYQHGEQMDSWNVREYVLYRDNHKCLHCNGKSKDTILQVHHLESRKTGGNAPNNLIILCKTCHEKYHSGLIGLKYKRGHSFKDAIFMGIMRYELIRRLKELYDNVEETYGYITKYRRIRAGLEKSHCIDARCITGNVEVKSSDRVYKFKAIRRHNRQTHKFNYIKGNIRPLKRKLKSVKGFNLYDKVKIISSGLTGYITSLRARGGFIIKNMEDDIIADITCKKLRILQKFNGFIVE